MDRTAIYIDIEGFSSIYRQNETRGLVLLGQLMEGIRRIGSVALRETSDRLFVHQTGDGFLILCDFADRGPTLPVSIGVVLLRYVLLGGGVAKCGVAQGRFADVRGCFPETIRSQIQESGVVQLGDGLMRIFPVMGTALINAYDLTRKAKGSLLLLDSKFASALPRGMLVSPVDDGCVAVDWVHAQAPIIDAITAKGEFALPAVGALEQLLRNYMDSPPLPSCPWIASTLSFNHCEPAK